ncbi:hypothetical protein KP509_08G016500 [Ceratopteris richardii]|uniref:Nuclear pore complex protein n=1 Tax=Ceratopteris richardii TaxID=49495 RepID=A0A8T2UED5_CERRI|nr:hypothetical protein KP509_08G016500 [Ceratopteris richardii]
MDFHSSPGSSSLLKNNLAAEKSEQDEPRIYSSSKAGGKVRSSRRGVKKSTPYDRPISGRHATIGGISSSDASTSSLASRIFGSASRVIASSASYFFPTLFGRKTLALTGNHSASESIIENNRQEGLQPVVDEKFEVGKNSIDSEEDPHQERDTKKESDLAWVENTLKQKSWSREQVGRLNDLLYSQLKEQSPVVSSPVEAGIQPSHRTTGICDLNAYRDEGNVDASISEAQRWREELKRARSDCAPIEIARAYMGERTSSHSRLTRSFRGTAHQLDRVAELQPPPGLGLVEDRYRSLPVLTSRTRNPAIQSAKKGPLLDGEWMSVGPVRKSRYKLFHINSSPYARSSASVEPVAPRTFTSPPIQSSQTARKILDTLEMLSPSPRSKFPNEKHPEVLAPAILSSEVRENIHRGERFKFSSPGVTRVEFESFSKRSASANETKKESSFEDKDAGNIWSPLAIPMPAVQQNITDISHTAASTGADHTDQERSFSFHQPSLKPETSRTVAGKSLASRDIGRLPESSMASHISVMTVKAHHDVAIDRLHSNGQTLDGQQGSANFGTSWGSPFAFKLGSSDSAFPPRASQSASQQVDGSKINSESPFCMPGKLSAGVSSPIFSSISAVSSISSSAPTSTTVGSLGSLPVSAPLSIAKPAVLTSLAIETPSVPFTFSSPPALGSCITPTFSFSNAQSVNAFSEAFPSKTDDTNVTPVFNFTSPSGRHKFFANASENVSLPIPTFTFGAETVPGSLGKSTSGLNPTFPAGGGFLGTAAAHQESSGSVHQSIFSAGFVQNPVGPGSPVNFTSGPVESQKAGRKILRAKRKK